MVSCEFVITTSCKMFNKLVYNLLDQAKPKKKLVRVKYTT